MGIREQARAYAEQRAAEEALASPNVPDDVASHAFDTAMSSYAANGADPEGLSQERPAGAPAPAAAAREQRALEASVGRAVSAAPRPSRPVVVHGTPLKLTPQQYEVLLRGINANRVSMEGGKSHLEAWDVRRTLIRIFGFGGFKIENKFDLIFKHIAAPGEIVYGNGGTNKKPAYTVVYSCETALTIFNPDGSVGAYFEDAATGDGANMPTFQAAADFAIKTAASQALKRCAVNLGDQFGLSLYNKGSKDPQVLMTLAGPVIEGGEDVVEQVVQSDRVHGEEDAGDPDDPGTEADDEHGLPSAAQLRDEATDPRTDLARLRAIYAMVSRRNGTHKAIGPTEVTNESGDTEPLDYLVYRKIQERKTGGNS